MSSAKRAAFSINVDSDADHIYERVSKHHPNGTDNVKVIESTGPTHSHTDISYITKPFEKAVNTAVDSVLESSGTTFHSAEGDLHYSNEKPPTSTSSSTLSIKNKSKRRALERKYDTSDL
jgi:ribose 5-phosphate isomerase B